VLAAEYLARPGFRSVALIGCGFIGRLHALGLLESFPAIERVCIYDQQRRAASSLAEELGELGRDGLTVTVCETAEEAVCRGELVAPCTVTARPYIELDWLMPGAFLSNISIMDVKPEVYLGVDKLIVDDWEQANRERKTINQLVLAGRLKQSDLHAELGDVVRGHKPGRTDPDERILLNPMGMAIEDVACAAAVYRSAREQGAGTWLTLA
jgi:N-[(2S)-2-amino-2-carboxyethyl]-L-glutamate dehydrogenase